MNLAISEYVGLYGAALSTLIAIAALVKWLRDIPKATVLVFNSLNSWPGQRTSSIVVANSGDKPFVVTSLRILFLKEKKVSSECFEEQLIDQRKLMDPALKSVPSESGEKSVKRVPNVIQPGDEYSGFTSEPQTFDPSQHWIRVEARIRGASKTFVGWAEPERRPS